MARSQREVFGNALIELAETYDDFVLLDGDLANSTRADILAEARPDRFVELGIAEQNLAGVAAGMASVGFRPWLSSFAVFLVHRDLDQVRLTIAQTGLPVRLAGSYSGLFTGYTGKSHQCFEDLAIMRSLAGMTVLCPGDAAEAERLIRYAHTVPGPVYIRLCRDPVEDLPPLSGDDGDPTRARWLKDGADLTLVTTGTQTTRTWEAARRLQSRGIDAGVLHLPALWPCDTGAIREAAERGPLVTTEEHRAVGGLGSLVTEVVTERNPVRVLRIGIGDRFGASGPNEDLLHAFGLSAEAIGTRVESFFREEAAFGKSIG